MYDASYQCNEYINYTFINIYEIIAKNNKTIYYTYLKNMYSTDSRNTYF